MSTTSRRNFLKLAGAASAGTVISEHASEIGAALAAATEGDVEVVWLQGQCCTGCTISLLQGEYPSLEGAIDDFRLAVTFHPTLMGPAGEDALASMSRAPDVLVVEGSIPTGMPEAATLGVDEQGHHKPIAEWVEELAPASNYVVAAGNCAAFGGWPAAENKQRRYGLGANVTGAQGLQFEGRAKGGVLGPDFTSKSGLGVVNLAGCPMHPDYLLLTLATVINGNTPEIDEYHRPDPFYEPNLHDECALRGYFDRGEFAMRPGDPGCLYKVGCAGPYTYCDDSMRLWNGRTSVCRNVGAPCIGCMEPAFWDRFTPFYTPVEAQNVFGIDADTAGKVALGGAAVGIGAHYARKLTGYGTEEEVEPLEETESGGED